MLVETEVIVGWEWLGLVSACGEDPPRKYRELVGLNYICTSCLASYPQLSLLGRHCLGEGKRRQKRYLTEVGRVVGKLASGNCFIIHSPCCRCTMKQEDHHEHRAETGWDKVSIPPGTVMIA